MDAAAAIETSSEGKTKQEIHDRDMLSGSLKEGRCVDNSAFLLD